MYIIFILINFLFFFYNRNSFNFVHKNAVRLYKCPASMTINDVEARITEEMKDLGY